MQSKTFDSDFLIKRRTVSFKHIGKASSGGYGFIVDDHLPREVQVIWHFVEDVRKETLGRRHLGRPVVPRTKEVVVGFESFIAGGAREQGWCYAC